MKISNFKKIMGNKKAFLNKFVDIWWYCLWALLFVVSIMNGVYFLLNESPKWMKIFLSVINISLFSMGVITGIVWICSYSKNKIKSQKQKEKE